MTHLKWLNRFNLLLV